MLTLVESISLAGDRAKQNDDAHGFAHGAAWVIDGATDLHGAPLTSEASDAAWIAQNANAYFHEHAGAHGEDGLRALMRDAATAAAIEFARIADAPEEKWKSPICSLLMAAETDAGVSGLDLGDCRVFALDAGGAVFQVGGPDRIADVESELAAKAAKDASGAALLRHEGTMNMLRRLRATQNGGGNSWTFCLDPACAEHARVWRLDLARPAYLLLATDGFAALVDRYHAYDAGTLVQNAVSRGLHELGRELRGIELADIAGAEHPRFKPSDDATALLLRLT